jgi:PAS domain S-box-containing protein
LALLPDSRFVEPYPTPLWARLALALLATGLAFALQWLLWQGLAPSPYFLFLSAVIVSAWLGGYGPGALATVLALVLTRFFFREPFAAPEAHHTVTSALFAGVAILMTLVCARVRSSLHEAHFARASSQANGHVLAITLRSIGDAVLTTDPNGLVRFINPVAAYLCGWRETDAIGQPLPHVLRLLEPSTRQPLTPRVLAHHEERPVQLGHQALLISKSGAELPIEHTAAPIRDSHGRQLGTVIVFRDISARFREDHEREQLLAREHDAHLEAEAQRERLETLFMQAPVAICLTRGGDHVVELVNPLGQTLVGERLSLGRSIRETVSGLDPNLLHLLDEVYRKGTPFVGHEVPLRADFSGTGQEEVKYFDLTWQPWRGVEGEILGTMGLCAEVTEQVLARREVEALAQDLQ